MRHPCNRTLSSLSHKLAIVALMAVPGTVFADETLLSTNELLTTGTEAVFANQHLSHPPANSGTVPLPASIPMLSDDETDWSVEAETSNPSPAPAPVASAPEPEPAAGGAPSFSLPGGYGRAPETITQGPNPADRRPPFRFSIGFEEGYDNNVLSASGKSAPAAPGQASGSTQGDPVIGSFFTDGFVGGEYNVLSKRHFLSLDFNGGGSYYLDRPGGKFEPNGTFQLIGAAKLNRRAQLSAFILAGYYSEPNLTLVNAPTQRGQGAYINTSTLIDLSYEWTKRFSTDTTLLLGSQTYVENASPGMNYVTVGAGQAFRHLVTHQIAAVLDLRAAETSYSGTGDLSDTEFLLVGFDANLSRRTAASFRIGETFQQYNTAGSAEPSSPFIESNLTHRFGNAKRSSLEWINRYGFENSTSATETRLTYRTGLHLSLACSRKVSALLGADYTYSDLTDIFGVPEGTEKTVNVSVGLEYLYAGRQNYYIKDVYEKVIESDVLTSYNRNQILIGCSWRF